VVVLDFQGSEQVRRSVVQSGAKAKARTAMTATMKRRALQPKKGKTEFKARRAGSLVRLKAGAFGAFSAKRFLQARVDPEPPMQLTRLSAGY
jgi:hypothetical protein